MIEKGVDKRFEQVRISGREKPRPDQLDCLSKFRIGFVIRPWVVPIALQLRYLFSGQTEEEEILSAHFLADLDVGAIQGSDGERSVHREFHVSGSRCFFSSRRNLLGEIGSRVDVLAVRY